MTPPQAKRPEKFIWKNSDGKNVPWIKQNGSGYICVRESTGEVVAAFSKGPWELHKKVGKARFFEQSNVLGRDINLMIFMSLLTILEKRRQNKNKGAFLTFV
jgi:hypothetical protein